MTAGWLERYEAGRVTPSFLRGLEEIRESLFDRWSRGRVMVEAAERDFARTFFRIQDDLDGSELQVLRDGVWSYGGKWGVRDNTWSVMYAHRAAERKMWESVRHCLRTGATGGDLR